MGDETSETTPTRRRRADGLLSRLLPGRRASVPLQAVCRGVVIAESDDVVVLEGSRYFPVDAVEPEHLRPSDLRTVCPWKGTASYYDLVVDGDVLPHAAWRYAAPSMAAYQILDRVAFSSAVRVRRARTQPPSDE